MQIRILWNRALVEGEITLTNRGIISGISSSVPGAVVNGASFALHGEGEKQLLIEVDGARTEPGPCKTIIHVRTAQRSFSFYLADVDKAHPIYIPRYDVIVTGGDDPRGYGEIVAAIHSRGLLSGLQQIAAEPEACFEAAAANTRNIPCVTWLGLSRDVRLFEVGLHTNAMPNEPWDFIAPKDHSMPVELPQLGISKLRYDYFAGRGVGPRQDLRRWLEDGELPILNVENMDGGVQYLTKMFTTYEKRALSADTLSGTNYLVSDFTSAYSVMTDSQREQAEALRLRQQQEAAQEETVLYMRIECINLQSTPRYCWMRIPQPNLRDIPERDTISHFYDRETGVAGFGEELCFLSATLDGKPVPLVETAVLLPPNSKCTYEFRIPHRPVCRAHLEGVAAVPFEKAYRECRGFWRDKLARGAQVTLPDKRVEHMMRAGLLHLDLVCFGREGEDAVAPVVGVYAPIGTESSPIIHYLESMGQTDLARRAIMYFLNKQHDNGFMQNFGSYMSETGFALFNAAEHYRYTGDAGWLRTVAPKLVKGCDFLISWSNGNKKEELRGRGYGMIAGKIADPEDPYHGYMLNASVYAALKSCGEVLAEIGDDHAPRLWESAEEIRGYIEDSLRESFAAAPVVPLSDGTWSIAISPWPESVGSVCLFAGDTLAFSHASSNARDTMTGISYLQYFDMLEPGGAYDDFIVNTNTDVFFSDNTGYSQPYYNVQPYAHLKRGEAKAFLKEFYCAMSSLADRETYTFWEHHFHVSPHKTHEEAWFLMRCRWMLAMEMGDCLSLLAGVPRRWLEHGESIRFSGVVTRLGTVCLELRSLLEEGKIQIKLRLESPAEAPRTVRLRVPHPLGLRARSVSDGRYEPESETVVLGGSIGEIRLEVSF